MGPGVSRPCAGKERGGDSGPAGEGAQPGAGAKGAGAGSSQATGKTRRSRGWEAAHMERRGDPPWSSEARGAKPERLRQSGLRSPLR